VVCSASSREDLGRAEVFIAPPRFLLENHAAAQSDPLPEPLQPAAGGPVKGAGALIIEPCKANNVSEMAF